MAPTGLPDGTLTAGVQGEQSWRDSVLAERGFRHNILTAFSNNQAR
jgi:hypothetical protein